MNSRDRWCLKAKASAHGLYKGGLVGGTFPPLITSCRFPFFLALPRRVALSLQSCPRFSCASIACLFSLVFGGGFAF
jgi:hypothetical protein